VQKRGDFIPLPKNRGIGVNNEKKVYDVNVNNVEVPNGQQ
jgi:hypothetical protein